MYTLAPQKKMFTLHFELSPGKYHNLITNRLSVHSPIFLTRHSNSIENLKLKDICVCYIDEIIDVLSSFLNLLFLSKRNNTVKRVGNITKN